MFTSDKSRVNFGIWSSLEQSSQFATFVFLNQGYFSIHARHKVAQKTFENFHTETSILIVRSRGVNVITVSHLDKMLLSRKFSFICYLRFLLVGFNVDADSQRGKQVFLKFYCCFKSSCLYAHVFLVLFRSVDYIVTFQELQLLRSCF